MLTRKKRIDNNTNALTMLLCSHFFVSVHEHSVDIGLRASFKTTASTKKKKCLNFIPL